MPKTLLKFAISLAALVFAFYNLELAEFARVAGEIDWLLMTLAASITLISVALLGLRWYGLLATIAAPRLSSAIVGEYIGLFGNNVFPLRLGEILRARYMSARVGAGFLKVLATIFLERLFDLVVVGGIAGLLLLAGTFAAAAFAQGDYVVPGTLALLATPLVIWAFRPIAVRLLIRRFGQTTETTSWIGSLLHGRTILVALAVSVALWAAYASRYQVVLLAIGLPFDLELVALLVVATVVGFMIPAAPGAIGTYHLAVVFSMHNVYGEPLAQAQVAAVMLHLSSYVPATLIGFLLFLRTRIGAQAAETAARPDIAGLRGRGGAPAPGDCR